MDFEEWEPVYEAILADLGYDRAADERARDRLATLTNAFDLDRLEWIAGKTVAIAGGGPSIDSPEALALAADADVVVAASRAADALDAAGVGVDVFVTDLDKNPETAVTCSAEGVPVVVHAHGDNVPAVESIVPRCAIDEVLPTTQARPVGPVRNFGGFTDGDRAAFLADHLGAAELVFPGWDLDEASAPIKRRKLEWAERLLYWLEIRRGDRFDLLDGRRDAIDTTSLPIE